MNHKMIIYRSIVAGLWMFPFSAFCLVLAAISAVRFGDCLMTLFVLIASCILAAAGIRIILDRKPMVTISEDGLFVRPFGDGVIPWSQIASADRYWMARTGRFIRIRLINGSMDSFWADGLTVDSKELLTLIQRRIEEKRRLSSSTPDA